MFICRTCTKLASEGYGLFEYVWGEEDMSLATIYYDTLHLELNAQDGLPHKVCQTCAEDLIQFYNFKKNCAKSETALREAKQLTQSPNCMSYEAMEIKDVIICISDDEEDDIVDVHCLAPYIDTADDDEVDAEDNILNNSDAAIRLIYADEEQSQLNGACVYDTPQSSAQESSSSSDVEDTEQSLRPAVTDKQLDDNNEKVIHLERDGEQFWIALTELRREPFVEPANAGISIRKRKGKKKRGTKSRRTEGTNAAEKSLSVKTGSSCRRFTCETCSAVFKSKGSLFHHGKTCRSQTDYLCQRCKSYFPNTASLRRHEQARVPCKPLSCTKCHRTFKSRENMDRHMIIRHNPLKGCSVCNKDFKTIAMLRMHENARKQEAGILCSHCDKIFCLDTDFLAHQRRFGKKK